MCKAIVMVQVVINIQIRIDYFRQAMAPFIESTLKFCSWHGPFPRSALDLIKVFGIKGPHT